MTRRYVAHKSKVPMHNVKATIGSKVKSCFKLCLSRNLTEANLMKLHRKIMHNVEVYGIHDLYCHTGGQGHCQGLKVKMCFHNNFKTTMVNIHGIKLHRKVKHSEKICHLQYFCSQTQGQGHNLG